MKGGNTDVGLPQFGPYSGEYASGFGGIGTGKGGGGIAPTYAAPQLQGQKIITGYQDVEQQIPGREPVSFNQWSKYNLAGDPEGGKLSAGEQEAYKGRYASYVESLGPQTRTVSEPIYEWQDLPQVANEQPQYDTSPIRYGGK